MQVLAASVALLLTLLTPARLQKHDVPTPPAVTGLPYPHHCTARRVPGGILPDRTCTPGSVNPAVTQATIRATICRTGWTATVRPSPASTAPVKTAAMVAYGQPAASRPTTELDHLVPLELGGSDDVTNLWPEPSDQPGRGYLNSKDGVESALNHAVCAGRVSLAAARTAIATNWATARTRLHL